MSAVHLHETWFLLFNSGFLFFFPFFLFLFFFDCMYIRRSCGSFSSGAREFVNIFLDYWIYHWRWHHIARCTVIYSYDIIITTVTLTSSKWMMRLTECIDLMKFQFGPTVWIFEIVISRRPNDGPMIWYLRIVHISYSKSNQVNWQYKMRRRVIQEFIDVASISK